MLIRYFDLGMWDGCQTDWMVNEIFSQLGVSDYEVYGFEASKEGCEYLKKRFSANSNVAVYNLAIAGENKVGPLYYGHKRGKKNPCANSIFADKCNVSSNGFELVEYIKFSDWLRSNIKDLAESLNIIKFNIEGAEWHLLRDLERAGLLDMFDIYCGAGSDMPKIKSLSKNYTAYNKIIKDHNIKMRWFAGSRDSKETLEAMRKVLRSKIEANG